MAQFLAMILTIVENWFIFKKMGRQGWEGIIPFYNTYVLFEELYGNGWKFLLMFIPFYNIYVIFKLYIDLAGAFNKSAGFGVGLVLLPPIFGALLAFGNDYFGDGSYANTEADFMTEAADTVKDFANRTTSGSKDPRALDKIKELADLRDNGVISDEEFEQKKADLLKRL